MHMARISIDSKIRDEWDLEVIYSLEVVFLWISWGDWVNSSLKCRAFRGALATTKEGRLGPFWKLRNPSLHVIFIKTYFSSSHPTRPPLSFHVHISLTSRLILQVNTYIFPLGKSEVSGMIQPITISADALRAASFCPIGHQTR
jgi:hypothetical protein